jgi:hypothetical protein
LRWRLTHFDAHERESHARAANWVLARHLRRVGWTITETDVGDAPRSGKPKVTGTVSGTVRAVRDMNRVWRELAS